MSKMKPIQTLISNYWRGQKKNSTNMCFVSNPFIKSFQTIPNIKYKNKIKDYINNCTTIYNECSKIQQYNNIPLLIGGDHSISFASISATLNNQKNPFVLWIDAHADINTMESSNTKNLHGMPLSFLTGLDYIGQLNNYKKNLPLSNLIYWGLRDVDNYEQKIIKNNNIYSFPCNYTKKFGIPEYLKNIKEIIGDNPVHISLDVDSLDPSYVSSTGTPVHNGLELYEIIKFLEFMKIDMNICAIDIMELNLNLGTEISKKKSEESVNKILQSLFTDENNHFLRSLSFESE